MAQVPEDFTPNVLPQTQGINVRATPDQTGLLRVQGQEKAASAAEQAGKLYGEIAADDANNTFIDGASQIRARVQALSGRAAMDAIPQAQEDLEQLYEKTHGSLYTTESQLNFEQISRRYRSAITSEIQDYGAAQTKIYGRETNNASIQLAKNSAAAAQLRGDGDGLAHSLDMLRTAYGKNANLEGLDDTGKQAAMLQADRDFAVSRINAAVDQDPTVALNIYKANMQVLAGSPELDSLWPKLSAGVAKQLGISLGTPTKPVSGKPQEMRQAIWGQETGNNSNAPTSTAGAVGPGQVKPDTFARFAKPGEKITDPDANRAVSGRYIDYLSALPNVQGDPARVAVGYFSGEGNIAAPGSATPWKADKKDTNGKTTSSYVQDVLGRLQTSAPTGVPSVLDGLPDFQQAQIMDGAISFMHQQVLRQHELTAVNDNPAAVVNLWHGIDTGAATLDDITTAVRAGHITASTAAEMTKAVDNGPRRSMTEKDAYGVLKSLLYGGAVETGQINIFGSNRAAEVQAAWGEAQGEWNRRVGEGQKPLDVLNDMVPRYAPQTRHPTWLTPLRFGDVQSTQDVKNVAVATLRARQAGQIDQQTYDGQVALLNQYRRFYDLEDQAERARRAGVKPPPKPQGGNSTPVSVTSGEPQ